MDMLAYFLGRVAAQSSGVGGVEYSSIEYKANDTIELIDTSGVTHTIVCEYNGDKLVSATYDGKVIGLEYNDDGLIGVGGTTVNLSNAPLVRLTTIKTDSGVFIPTIESVGVSVTSKLINITADSAAVNVEG